MLHTFYFYLFLRLIDSYIVTIKKEWNLKHQRKVNTFYSSKEDLK